MLQAPPSAQGEKEFAQPRSYTPTQQKLLLQQAASIYLNQKQDPLRYARCYRDIVAAEPTVYNNIILGDALLEIGEAQEAIDIYEKALGSLAAGEPTGAPATAVVDANSLVRKIGSALMLTHDYEAARNYYVNAVRRDPQAIDLRIDLANLFLKLENYQRAISDLEEALHSGVKLFFPRSS